MKENKAASECLIGIDYSEVAIIMTIVFLAAYIDN